MLAPSIRSSLGELQGTLHLVGHDLTDRADKDTATQRCSELVVNAQRRVSELSNMLSLVSYWDALARGELTVQAERIDLLRLFEQMAHRLNAARADDPVALEIRCQPSIRQQLNSVAVDASNLRNLLSQLLRFAWTTTRQSQVLVDVELSTNQLTLVIADCGSGMSELELKQLFSIEPWSPNQVAGPIFDDPTLRLGLSLALALARAMQGTCQVLADSDRGLVWKLKLPTVTAPALAAEGAHADDLQLSASALPSEQSGWLSKTLLMVDDSPSSRMVTRALLEDLGHEVVEAANGVEALVRLRSDPKGPFDGVILDLAMPQMDGLSAARAIRQLPAAMNTVCLIALTGHSSEAERQACSEAGFNDFLSKPLDKLSLEECLRRTLGVGSQDLTVDLLNLSVLEDLQKFVGDDAMQRLLNQFLAELKERMQVICSPQTSSPDELHHNVHMMRYSAEHFGFERLAQCAKRLGQLPLSLDDVGIATMDAGTPALIFAPSQSAVREIKQLQRRVEEVEAFLLRRLQQSAEQGDES
ncbi:MAG: response regulator [Proteobacteria bacterium]|nr:response regulator [Pseudomonadota bacterium]